MTDVLKDGNRHPFSKGILATSLAITGLPLEKRYEIVREINRELDRVEVVHSREIRQRVQRKLRERGLRREEKFYRVTRQLSKLEKPLFILLGGTAGIGKSTLSVELAHRLDINRIIETDTVREIMRNMVSTDLVPCLYRSSFNTDETVKADLVDDSLIYGFNQQVSVVSTGVKPVIDRGVEEGVNSIVDGVHVVPGYLGMADRDDCHAFQYVLEVPNQEEHARRFGARANTSNRNAGRYLENIEAIRTLQDYIVEEGKRNGATIITNESIDQTIEKIMDDVTTELGSVVASQT
ncbi:AAA family ATPase [Halalkalicoccus salilacus]|uniref:AAA family ATPase n=1 Tax=Halalkalicoccus salilacus TaxID=3117459 RepID=UPI00300E84B6